MEKLNVSDAWQQLIDKYNIEWGGEWKKVDAVHFQIRGAGKIPYKTVYKK